MHIVFSMSEARTDRPVRGSVTAHAVTAPQFNLNVFCFYTRNGAAAAVLPKRRLHLARYKSTALSHSRSPLKGTFR